MGHEITVREDGRAEAAFALRPAWHGLGVVLDHPMTSAEALEAAGLNWRVEQVPVAAKYASHYEDIRGVYANVRSDTHAVLGIVSGRYKVVQNDEAFAFLDRLIEDHQMEYESAFSLRGGKQVVLLARLPKSDQIVSGDEVLRYVLLSLAHDGEGSIRFGPTSVRVVCANTFALASKSKEVKSLSIRHSGDIDAKLQQARDILRQVNDQFDKYAEVGRELAKVRLSAGDWFRLLDVLCPLLDEADPDYTERRQNQLIKTRRGITQAFHNWTQASAPRSAWAAFNAVTEFIDHLPRRGATYRQKAEARFNVCLFGPGRDMKQRAFEAVCRIAGVAV